MIAFKTLFTTFYSYKGGVGRTSSLVNSAILRAIAGDRVVVLDFDLEAPGVSSYVNEIALKNNVKINLDSRPGILDYLYDAIQHGSISEIKKNAITGEDLGLKMKGSIWFVGAGNITDPEYTKKLGCMNWAKIFEEKHGALLLENLKRQIEAEFGGPDYVFIDSRTGITETGGVCTKYLADLVVVLASLNEQNTSGTSRIYQSFKQSKISTILVASNVPVGLPWGDGQLFKTRIDNFSNAFKSPPDLLIYHYPSLSLVEYLPAWFKFEEESAVLNEDPLLKSYETLSNKIESKNECSFDNFLSEMLFTSGMLFNFKREKGMDEYFAHFRKYYSNRLEVCDLIQNIYKLRKYVDSSGVGKLDAEFMNLFAAVKKSKCADEYRNLYFLRRMILDNASDLLISYYSKHKDKIKQPISWYELIEQSSQFDALCLLLNAQQYQFVYDSVSEKKVGGYRALLKASAAERMGRKDASKYYSAFLDGAHNERMEAASNYFAYSYAAVKLQKIDLSRVYLDKAKNLVAKEDTPYFFVPTKFIRVKTKKDFLKELSDFKNKYHLD